MKWISPSGLKWAETPVSFRVIWLGAIANFASFWIIAVVCGGDALNGKEEAGKYFLSSHGHDTEVTRSFFEYSRFHALSIWITHPLAIVSLAWVLGRKSEAKVV